MRLSRLSRVAALLLLVGAAFGTLATTAFPTGPPPDAARDGCTCHGAASPATVPSLSGLPWKYENGKLYPVTVSSVSSVERVAGATNLGGFQLMVSDGVLTPVTSFNDTWMSILGNQQTAQHTDAGARDNGPQIWDVTWQAPSKGKGEVAFWVAVNRVNGDGTFDGDHWNRIEQEVEFWKKGAAPGLDLAAVLGVLAATVRLSRRRHA